MRNAEYNPRGRLILHIGLLKTGITTIQHFLHENRLAFKLKGVIYPFDDVSHGKLAASASLTNNNPNGLFSNLWEELSKLSKDNLDEHIGLNSKDFSFAMNLRNKVVVNFFFDGIRSLGRQTDVLIYLRKQIKSFYNQHLKRISRIELNRFIKVRKKLMNCKGVFCFWQKNLKKECTLKPAVFEKHPSGDICFDFLKLLGIEKTEEHIGVDVKNKRHTLLRSQVKIPGRAVNPELLNPATAVIALVNEFPYLGKNHMPSPQVATSIGKNTLKKAGFIFILPATVFAEPAISLSLLFCSDRRELLYSTGHEYTLYRAE